MPLDILPPKLLESRLVLGGKAPRSAKASPSPAWQTSSNCASAFKSRKKTCLRLA